MEQENKKSNTKKAIFLVVGLLLIIGTVSGGNLNNITDWSTAQLAGYNTMSLIMLLGGAYLIHLSAKK